MANRVINWRVLLELVNEDLKKYNAEIGVYDHDDVYSVTIIVNGVEEEYADGYYEDELGDLINDAWAHARAKVKPQIAYLVHGYYDKGICDDDEPLLEIYATEELAKARVGQLIRNYKDRLHRSAENAEDWTEKGDSLKAYGYEPYSWNVDIFWTPELIRNKID